MTVSNEVLAAFSSTAIEMEENGFTTEAGLKEVINKGKELAHKGSKALKNKLMKFHKSSMDHHKQAIEAIHRDPGSAVPGDHTYHKVMHSFHKARYESALRGKKDKIHSTMHPKKIEPREDKHGNQKPPASRAEQAAFQHHREAANDIAHSINKKVAKGKGDHPETYEAKKLHKEHDKAAKSITRKRSMPKAHTVKPKETPEEAEKEIKRHGNFGRKHSDETRKKMSEKAKARHAARKEEKAKAERKEKRLANKAAKAKESGTEKAPAKKRGRPAKPKEEKPKIDMAKEEKLTKSKPKKAVNEKAKERMASKKKAVTKKPRLQKKA